MVANTQSISSANKRPLPIPGPRGHWFFGSTREMQRDPLGFYLSQHQLYGDIVRFNAVPPYKWYLISHPEDVDHILYKNQQNYPKGDLFNNHMRVLMGEGLLTSEGEFWRRQRRLAQPAFHRQQLIKFGEIFTQAALDMVKEWQPYARSGQAFDIAAEMMRLTLKVAGLTLFSTDISHQASEVGNALRISLEHLSYRMYHPFSLPEYFPLPRNFRLRQALNTLDEVVYKIINTRHQRPTQENDLLNMLLNARDEETGQGMSDKQLRDEVLTLLLAGHETTAVALSWTWYLLTTHPEINHKLASELDQQLNRRTVTVGDLASLNYLRMVLDESLRLYPPVWVILRQALKDDEIRGYPIKAGYEINVCQYVTHRHPDFWETPHQFNPDHFLPEKVAARPRSAYFPFSAGGRQCIGNNFALMEMQMMLATLAQHYHFELVKEHIVEVDPTFTLRPRNGVMVKIKAR